MLLRDDFIVRRKDQYEIAQIARHVLDVFSNCIRGGMVDPVCILKALRRFDLPHKGALRIVLTSQHNEDSPARVSYKPLTLTVSRKIWWEARPNNTNFASWLRARWILLHELGHIFLHDQNAKAYSNDQSVRTRLPKEVSAEDQADKFAMFLACPMRPAISKMSAEDIVTLHGLPDDVSEEILEIFSTYVLHKQNASYTQITCTECGSSLKHMGSYLSCDSCVPPVTIPL